LGSTRRYHFIFILYLQVLLTLLVVTLLMVTLPPVTLLAPVLLTLPLVTESKACWVGSGAKVRGLLVRDCVHPPYC
jgi:hypothetical protein